MNILFIGACVVLLCNEGDARRISQTSKLLHHHMTKGEIEHYFGVSGNSEVPEYDVVEPHELTEEEGTLLGTRQSRSTEKSCVTSYKVHAFGIDLNLELMQNDGLMAPGLQLEEVLPDGGVALKPAPENTFYLGHVNSHLDSLVAVSNDHGLTGMIRHKRDTMFIQPLPEHLAKHFRNKRHTQPHLIYKTKPVTKREDHQNIEGSDLSSTVCRFKRSADTLVAHDVGIGDGFKYLEAALMADDVVASKYGEENIYKHLMLVANIVAGIFMDESIGKSKIMYTVTKIGVIPNSELGMKPGSKTPDMALGAMLKWVEEHGRNNLDLFTLVVDGILGGRATGDNMCKGAVNVVEDKGLQTAGIVAHETGHTIGLKHDGTFRRRRKDCPAHTFVMAPSLPSGPNAYRWSPCSSETIQSFLNSERSECLDNVPFSPVQDGDFSKLVGQIVDADGQCRFELGDSYFRCSRMIHECGVLWCTDSLSAMKCVNGNVPVLDGTPCGGRKWCYREECVDNGSPYIEGGWSEWSEFVPCTMKCGGGITYRERTCTNPTPLNEGRECHGITRKDYKVCNHQPCKQGDKSYRQQQCERLKPGSTVVYPHTLSDLCVVQCMFEDKTYDAGNATDGDRCSPLPHHNDVCINGDCQKVGCDHVLDSRGARDRCEVCGGDGTTCSRVQGVFKDTPKRGVENSLLMVDLPVGSTDAFFQAEKETYDIIGIQNKEGEWMYRPYTKTITFIGASSMIEYHHSHHFYKDTLYIDGPISEHLRIMFVRRNEANPGIDYVYHVPIPKAEQKPLLDSVSLDWKIGGNWSHCSEECAGGFQTRPVHCSRSDDHTLVGIQHCSQSEEPESHRECNVQDCAPRWFVTQWNDCSKTCGGGTQSRSIVCFGKSKNDGEHELADDDCSGVDMPDVGKLEHACKAVICPPVWDVTSWSECSTTCDAGLLTRTVKCVRQNERGEQVVVPNLMCDYLAKLDTQQRCNEDKPCAPAATKCPPASLCKTGATCVDDPAGYKCKCSEAYEGYYCEAKKNPCNSSPCQNGATCVADATDYKLYTCQCSRGYEGFICGERINPCDDKPCVNGGKCVANEDVLLEYDCGCSSGYSGKTCQVPPTHGIGCFKLKRLTFKEPIADFKGQFDSQDTKPVIDKCAELAYNKGYSHFLLGFGGKCYSDGSAKSKYHKDGVASSKKHCPTEIGYAGTAFAFTFENQPAYTSLGCYDPGHHTHRVLPVVLGNFQHQFDADSPESSVILPCAYVASDSGYEYFAVLYNGLCITGEDAGEKYKQIGEVDKVLCHDGVGINNRAMAVYQLKGDN